MDRYDIEAAREGRAITRWNKEIRPSYAYRKTTALTSLKGTNHVFGGNGGEDRHARITGTPQIPHRPI